MLADYFLIKQFSTLSSKSYINHYFEYSHMNSFLRLYRSFTFLTLVAVSGSSISQQAISVDVMYPDIRDDERRLSLSGTVEAKQQAQLASLEAGLVKKIHVEIGDLVTSGQPLLELDNRLALLSLSNSKANLESAQVNLDEAIRLYKEAQNLSEKQVIAATLIAQREASVKASQAQLSQAKAQVAFQQAIVERHILVAPFDGAIVNRQVEVGEWLSTQDDTFTLISQNNLRVNVSIPQEYFYALSNQESVGVTVTPDLSSKDAIQASITRLVPASTNLARAFIALVDLPPNSPLMPGMSVTAQVALPKTNTNELVLPRSAIKQHPDGGSSVFVVENNRAKRINTPFSRINSEQIAIPNPSINLPFIVTAVELLVDNAPVSVNQVRTQP